MRKSINKLAQDEQNRLQAEKIRLLYSFAPLAIPFNVFIALIASLFFISVVPLSHLILFFISVFIISAIRYTHVKIELKKANWVKNITSKKYLFCLGCLIQSLLWGCWYLYFVMHLGVEYQYLLLFLLGGLVAGAMTTMSSDTIIFHFYAIPMLLIPAIWYIVQWNIHSIPFAGIIILYLLGILKSHKHTQAYINSSIKLTIEKEKLISNLNKANEKLEHSNAVIKKISLTDELTKVANRRYFMDVIEKEWRRNRRASSPLSILMIDIDYFKFYNDTLGHQKGDECLVLVAEAINRNIRRAGDFVARYGGEEFVCILPATPLNGAIIVAHYILKTLNELKIPHPASDVSEHVTVSIGIATTVPNRDGNFDELIAEADKCLYKAKQFGRNRVVYD